MSSFGPNHHAAVAWLQFDGQSTVTIRDSFNHSSVTDYGTGQYGPNYSSSLANGNYSLTMGGNLGGNSEPRFINAEPYTGSYHRVRTANASSSSALDWDHVQTTTHGDLA